MGFGVYRGVGGSLAELDQEQSSGRREGLRYGCSEGEFGLSHFTSLIGRLMLGGEALGASACAESASSSWRPSRASRSYLCVLSEIYAGHEGAFDAGVIDF